MFSLLHEPSLGLGSVNARGALRRQNMGEGVTWSCEAEIRFIGLKVNSSLTGESVLHSWLCLSLTYPELPHLAFRSYPTQVRARLCVLRRPRVMLTLLNVPSATDAWVHLVSAQARIRWAGLRVTLRRARFDLRSAASRSHPFAVASNHRSRAHPFPGPPERLRITGML